MHPAGAMERHKMRRYRVAILLIVVLLFAAAMIPSRFPLPRSGAGVAVGATASWKLVGFKGKQVWGVLVDPRSPNKVFVVPWRDGAYRSLDYGKTWTCLTRSIGSPWGNAIAMDAFDSKILYLADDRGLYRSLDGGTTWKGVYVGPKGSQIRCLCADPSHKGVLFAGNDDYGVVKYTGYATTIDPVTMNFLDYYSVSIDRRVQSLTVDPTNSQRLYAGTLFTLYRSNDGGESWYGGTTGAVNTASGGFIGPTKTISSIAVNAKGVVFADIGMMAFPRPKVDNSGLYRSINHGLSWNRINTGFAKANTFPTPSVSKVCFNPKNSNEIFAASDTGVYRSTDGGKTWKPISTGLPASARYVHCLALDPKNPHVLYAGTDEGLYKLAF